MSIFNDTNKIVNNFFNETKNFINKQKDCKMEIILVKTTTCAKCRQLQPIFEEFCSAYNISGRIICYDTASSEDKSLVEDAHISSVPSLIFIENDFKRVYSDIYNLDGITSAKDNFLACKGV